MEQNIALAHEYVKKHFVDKGMIADVCVHDTGTGNHHAHVMLTIHPIEPDGTWRAKSSKEYILDAHGERIRLPSGEYKSRKVNSVDWNEQTKAEDWRKGWADMHNLYLEKNGITERVDHRSFERQGNGLVPTIHLGIAASQMERKGIITEKGNHNRQVEITNKEIKQTKTRIRQVKNWLYTQPLTNAPTMFDIMGKVAEGKNLKTNWQHVRNVQTSAKVLMFLTSNNITGVEEFADKVVQIHERLRDITDEIKAAEHQKRGGHTPKCGESSPRGCATDTRTGAVLLGKINPTAVLVAHVHPLGAPLTAPIFSSNLSHGKLLPGHAVAARSECPTMVAFGNCLMAAATRDSNELY